MSQRSTLEPPRRAFTRAVAAALLLTGTCLAAALLTVTPQRAEACGGTPPPPPAFCGKGYSFGKVSPGTIAVPANTQFTFNLTTWHYLTLIEHNPQMPVCPPPPHNVMMTITVGNCIPGGPGVGPFTVGPFSIVQGAQTIVTPVTMPAGPARQCTISVSSTVTFSDGTSIGPLTGDAEICIVDELPGQPGVPRLDLEPLTPQVAGAHAGDQPGVTYRVTNNDPTESWTGTVFADFRNTAKQPGESPAGPVRTAFALADPGAGDQWPIEFAHNLPPNGCIPLPPDPQNQTLSEITSDPITLAPGETADVEVVARPWGMCLDGSCGESSVVAEGTYSDGTTGLACAGALYHVDNTLPPQYLWPDSGATVLFDPGSDPFIPLFSLQAFPPDPISHYQALARHIPGNFLVNGTPTAASRNADPTSPMDPYTGRFTEVIQPPPFVIDSFFDVEYRIEFGPQEPTDPIQIEIVQMNLVGNAPGGFENVAPMGMGLGEVDNNADNEVDSLLDLFTQINGYAQLDDGNVAPIQFLSLEFLPAGNGFDVHAQGVVGAPGSRVAATQSDLSRDADELDAQPLSAARGGAIPTVVSLILMTDLRGYARAVPPTPCVGDLDGDGDTDIFDFGIFAPAFGTSLGDPGFVPAADLNNDNTIDIFDFGIFAPDFGCTP